MLCMHFQTEEEAVIEELDTGMFADRDDIISVIFIAILVLPSLHYVVTVHQTLCFV